MARKFGCRGREKSRVKEGKKVGRKESERVSQFRQKLGRKK